MASTLNQKDIDTIFSTDNNNTTNSIRSAHNEEYTIYDFKRPSRVSKDQLRSFKNIHDKLARGLSTDISSLLRTAIDISLQSVDQMTYNEFLISLPNFTSFNVFSMKPLEGKNVVEMNTDIVYAMLDILLGGAGETHYDGNKEFTDIELNLLDTVLKIIMKNIKDVWADVIEVNPIVNNKDSSPNVYQIVALNEVVVWVMLVIVIGNISGVINICYPVVSLDHVMQTLAEKDIVGGVSKQKHSKKDEIKVLMSSTKMDIDFEIGRNKLKLKDVLGLEINDVIKLDTKAGEEVSLVIDKEAKYKVLMIPSKYSKKFKVIGNIDNNDTVLVKAIDRLEKAKIDI